MIQVRVALTEKEFRQLVAGKEITVLQERSEHGGVEVKIILSDIGWDRMEKALMDAVLGDIT